MKQSNQVPTLLLISIIIPLIIAYWTQSWIAYIVLGVWIVAVYAKGVQYTRDFYEKREQVQLGEYHNGQSKMAVKKKQYQAEHQKQRAEIDQAYTQLDEVYAVAVDALSHHRHDWMNELQLLYGYVQLGKRDKQVECVERIKEQMLAESRVSKLGIHSLVFYLQSFKAVNRSIQLEVELSDGITLADRLGTEQSEELTRVIKETVSAYEQFGGSSWGECPTLFLMVSEYEGAVHFIFEPEEEYPNPDGAWEAVNLIIQDTGVTATRTEEDPASISLQVLVDSKN
ncbi:hypothetical protein PTI45_00006 [Paenibacillus nuruki]|uniref:SpoOB alpha-helical domain-containing protein n=1 Tax=Paenibacillus nuruki TaxID=1886670 RepID=A0A1E3L9N4_9BACL|nr:Spo0B domain-containing protein [Paenibacillus nuruki]ODP30499.1 hypothetical protein PTI45_00006 [Paenibacillus nuruki]